VRLKGLSPAAARCPALRRIDMLRRSPLILWSIRDRLHRQHLWKWDRMSSHLANHPLFLVSDTSRLPILADRMAMHSRIHIEVLSVQTAYSSTNRIDDRRVNSCGCCLEPGEAVNDDIKMLFSKGRLGWFHLRARGY
jgi:hypothetical protein